MSEPSSLVSPGVVTSGQTGDLVDHSTGASTGASTNVELRLPADGAYVSVLRTLTAGLATRLDLTMDDIEDLRIAVSEATAMVLDEADADAVIDCHFRLAPGALSLTISAASQNPSEPDYESFGWQVLATLTAEAAIDTAPGRYAVRLTVRSSLTP